MNKLIELDNTQSPVILDEEVSEIISEWDTEYLIKYNFKNPILMGKVWKSLCQTFPDIAEIPEGRMYRYLTQINFEDYPTGWLRSEVAKFWNLPNIIVSRLFNILSPELHRYLIKLPETVDGCKDVIKVCNYFPTCRSYINLKAEVAIKLLDLERKAAKVAKEQAEEEELDNHKISLRGMDSCTMVMSLLMLNGYLDGKRNSIYQAKKLDLLLWLATGMRLTDIVDSITKFIKVKDTVYCKVNSRYLTTNPYEYDYEKFGLGVDEIYKFYKNECIEIGKENGRLLKMYPGYSLDTLKSTIRSKVNTGPKAPSVSEYEVMSFIDSHLTEKFEWSDVKDYLKWMEYRGINPILSDSGDGYIGISIDSDKIYDISKILVKYNLTEFMNIRKVLVGILDDEVKLTPLSRDELVEFDNDVACQIIHQLVEWESIKYEQLMADMKWLRVIGHIGITLKKSERGVYRIYFNSVSFLRVTELISKSDYGYNTAREVLERLSNSSKFYRKVLDGFNEAIWNLHKCQIQLTYNF